MGKHHRNRMVLDSLYKSLSGMYRSLVYKPCRNFVNSDDAIRCIERHHGQMFLSFIFQKRKHCTYKPGSVPPESGVCHLSSP